MTGWMLLTRDFLGWEWGAKPMACCAALVVTVGGLP